MCRAPRPKRCGSLSASTAARTRSRFSSGSPMPMNTMFVRRLPSGGQPAGGVADLVDDLGGLEVAPEAELARGTERAAHRAAGLARDAQRVPLARGAAGRVVHQDGLDELAVIESMEGLLGQPAVRDAKLGVVDRVEAEVARQRRRAGRRQGADLGRRR